MKNTNIIPTGHEKVKNLQVFGSAPQAFQRIQEIYSQQIKLIRDSFQRAISCPEREAPFTSAPGTYPYIGISVPSSQLNTNASLSYGAVTDPGIYGTTLTRPDIFEDYYLEQIHHLIEHHKAPVVVGESTRPIPLPFALDSFSSVDALTMSYVQDQFVFPDLSNIDDEIVNGTYRHKPENPLPLALFTGERVDYSLHRLHHYTGTDPSHFQRFILLTNYQRYMDAFREYSLQQINYGDEFSAFVEPGDVVTPNPSFKDILPSGAELKHLPQMPAYHLKRPDRNGITFINIGVGPSNAKTITDHLAVLRPHCWIMLGHCAGLRRSQLLGDYVLAHGYVREDHVLDQDLPLWVPVPPVAEVQVALQKAVTHITGLHGLELKTRMRTGTVVTTDNRNWEMRSEELLGRFKQSRAIALDMEAATVAANGFRFRVPYGTLLCVSDKPIHGEIKLRGMANNFYRERVDQHLKIGLETVRILRDSGIKTLHSRKLRGFEDPAFR
jgi:AMP nucleosidase